LCGGRTEDIEERKSWVGGREKADPGGSKRIKDEMWENTRDSARERVAGDI